ncbi:MAG: type VII secretion protein EssB/YukC [Mycoplasmatales bacterium]
MIIRELYKSELNLKTQADFEVLNFKAQGLLPIKITEINDEQVELKAELNDQELVELSAIDYLSEVDGLQIAEEVAMILKNKSKFIDFELAPTNIYVTKALHPHIFIRKIAEETDELKVVASLIALTISLVSNKDYETVLMAKTVKHGRIINFENATTLDEVITVLEESISQQKQILATEFVVVKAKKYQSVMSRNLYKNVTIIALTLLFAFAYFYFYAFATAQVKAYQDYGRKDYNAVVNEINKYSSRLDNNAKLVLVNSIINSQNLSDVAKKNLTVNLDENTDEAVFKYWFSIAANDFTAAQNYAKTLNDVDLQMYAIISNIEYLKTADIAVDEKTRQQGELEKALEDLKKQANPNAGADVVGQW